MNKAPKKPVENFSDDNLPSFTPSWQGKFLFWWFNKGREITVLVLILLITGLILLLLPKISWELPALTFIINPLFKLGLLIFLLLLCIIIWWLNKKSPFIIQQHYFFFSLFLVIGLVMAVVLSSGLLIDSLAEKKIQKAALEYKNKKNAQTLQSAMKRASHRKGYLPPDYSGPIEPEVNPEALDELIAEYQEKYGPFYREQLVKDINEFKEQLGEPEFRRVWGDLLKEYEKEEPSFGLLNQLNHILSQLTPTPEATRPPANLFIK